MIEYNFYFFFVLFMTLLAAPIVKNIHIWAGIYFILLKNVLKQTWKFFNNRFGPHSNYQKSSYQVRQI